MPFAQRPTRRAPKRLQAIPLKATMRICYRTCFPFLLFLMACNKGELEDSPSDLDRLSSSTSSRQQFHIDSRIERWAPGTVKVEAVVYDCEEGRSHRISNRPLVKNGEKHPFIIEAQTRILNSDDVTRLATLLSVSSISNDPAYCYIPHHGFLFYGASGEIHAYVEICLLCRRGVARPKEGLAKIWDYDGLETFIASIGLPVFDSVEEWDDYFAKSRMNR